jgi:hypothetical protein
MTVGRISHAARTLYEEVDVTRNILVLASVIVSSLVLAVDVYAGEIVRFDFQSDDGEGQYELFRVEADIRQQTFRIREPVDTGSVTVTTGKGELCFLQTESSSVPDRITRRFADGELWTDLVDIKSYEHACFTFDLHEPLGWFRSPVVRYAGEEYTLFFVGEMSTREMKGMMYEFFTTTRPDGGKDRFGHSVYVSARGVPAKKKEKGN